MDASFRLQTNELTKVYKKAMKNGGVVMFSSTRSSITTYTNHQMYDYLPSNVSLLNKTTMVEANSFLMYRTEIIYNEIFRWWLYCAIDGDCIAPPDTTILCYRVDNHLNKGCHRQDQSALNILLANAFDFQISRYTIDDARSYVKINRSRRNEIGQQPKTRLY